MNDKEAERFARQEVQRSELREGPYKKSIARDEKFQAAYYMKSSEYSKGLAADTAALTEALNKTIPVLEEQKKAYSDIAIVVNKLAKLESDLNEDGVQSVKERIDLYKQYKKVLDSIDYNKLDGDAIKHLKHIKDEYDNIFDIALNYNKKMKEASQSIVADFADNLDKVSDRIIKLSNAFSLQKLVTGGTSLNDLQKMQGNVKMSLNIDNSGFMSVQGQLVEQNKELLAQTGQAYLTFSDSLNYLSNIKDYSMKNYNQATALYKQVAIGTRYLGLSNQGISAMVKATNQMADDSYMNRQLAMLSALGADSALSEDIEGLAQFQALNTAGVMARYNNGEQTLKDSSALLSVAETYLGNNSKLIENMMSEIMNTNNFANLSQQTQDLLSMTGLASSVHSQMASGNLNMNQTMSSFLNNMYSFSQRSGGIDTMEQMGLGEWATMAYSYNRNRSEFEDKLLHQTELIAKVNMNDADAMDQIEKILSNNVNKNFWEKFTDKIFTSLGIQNQNWEALNGTVQMINTLVSGSIATINLVQSMRLLSIKNLVAAIAVKQGLKSDDITGLLKEGGFGSGGLKSLLGKVTGNATAMKALGVGSIVAGGLMGVHDAVQMQGSTGAGWLADGARGFFLGTGASNHSASDNAGSVLGNTAKGALIGAGIGTLLGGPVIGTLIGGAAGLLLGALGTAFEDNTEAVKDNTKAYESNDSIAQNSYIAQAYKNYLQSQKNAPAGSPISYGVGAGGTSNTGGYPWAVTSPYGNRTLSNGDSRFHNGIDFGITTGTPVGAPVAGKVQYVQIDPYNTYHLGSAGWGRGTGVNLLGDDGVIYQFWHLSKTGLQTGDRVDAGGLVGLSGNTGYSTGDHLHFGTKVGGNWVNPAQYIKEGLFSADGKSYTASTSSNSSMTLSTNQDPSYYFGLTADSKMFLNKDQLFSFGQGAAPTSTTQSVPTNFATSSDIDRLIDTINDMRAEQNDQRAFMQALAGKNAFVYGRS